MELGQKEGTSENSAYSLLLLQLEIPKREVY